MKMSFSEYKIDAFKEIIWAFYAQEGRLFDWRHNDDPYKIVVSEIMLQQTQTHRVAQKYSLFIEEFPTFSVLAQASLRDVLSCWQGLGYNRRGKYLHQIAQQVVTDHQGVLPQCTRTLETYPGIGKATAASICAFAFNMPTVFIETNIRTVFIHFFFYNKKEVYDSEIMPLIEAALDTQNSREWYYALMDYGVFLKKQLPNPSRKSVHHAVQSKFEGSDRQIRGMILKLLTQAPKLTLEELCHNINRDPERIKKIALQLCTENILMFDAVFFSIQ